MIGRIQGVLVIKQPPYLMVDVNGVGYELQAPMSTFYRLPELGQAITLLTHLVVREDAHLLYGFIKEQERAMFRSLIKVSNIGPKSALTILSGIEPEAFARCILEQDTASLSKLPGIGKKTAERLVIEMRDRIDDWQATTGLGQEVSLGLEVTVTDAVQDAISALVALGYKPQDAKRAIQRIEQPQATREELIKLALQSIIRG